MNDPMQQGDGHILMDESTPTRAVCECGKVFEDPKPWTSAGVRYAHEYPQTRTSAVLNRRTYDPRIKVVTALWLDHCEDVAREPLRIQTWTDGFGRWHALIPDSGAGEILAARYAIRAELLEREQKTGEDLRDAKARLSAYVRENVTRVPGVEHEGAIEFVEYLIEGEK